ncbi:amino acid ABC transporter permease [Mycolicibacterium neoaurum]|uniref:amino acid ABC transporter permease n=1 Tax=Mycolicibacterium neoaurum TaxID=1795 RepID=UPI00248B01B5|nr:amino acid ABC transporter permease [Mycolicibacterium neoaurum]WBP93352.1 amino acid ABC transporter permease [Mycolicibacterium neoaurum]WBS06972.1 amino acid ABC transporter permease [Mycolicibacterium neoaurum]
MTSVLYDLPGPKAKRRNLLLSLAGTLLLCSAVAFVLVRMAETGQFDARLWSWITYSNVQNLLLHSLGNTLAAFTAASALSLALGLVLAAARFSDNRLIVGSATVFTELFRAIPVLVLIFILFFGLSRGLGVNISSYWAVVLGLTLYMGSVLGEVFRAGVLAVPRGQSEAAYALGLRKNQALTAILLPQALRFMLPTILSQLVVVLKDTALGFVILYPELLYQARYLGSQGQLGAPIIQVGMVVAAIYISMCLLLSGLAKLLERRLNTTAKAPQRPRSTRRGRRQRVAAAG